MPKRLLLPVVVVLASFSLFSCTHKKQDDREFVRQENNSQKHRATKGHCKQQAPMTDSEMVVKQLKHNLSPDKNANFTVDSSWDIDGKKFLIVTLASRTKHYIYLAWYADSTIHKCVELERSQKWEYTHAKYTFADLEQKKDSFYVALMEGHVNGCRPMAREGQRVIASYVISPLMVANDSFPRWPQVWEPH